MNVLSLFDGISCGQIALNRSGIKCDSYYASEIHDKSILVTQHHYPNTIQLGDVTKIKGTDLPKIDLLMGGSPCQDLSMAKPNGLGLAGERSGLFWEFVRLLNETQPAYFLLENVIMKKHNEEDITKALGVEPIEINSSLVSAQRRRRLYWTNIPNVTQPEDRGIVIKDIVYDDSYKIFTDERITKTKVRTKNYVKWDTSGKQYWSQQDRAYYRDGKMCTLPKGNPGNKLNIVMDYDKDIYRRLHPVEAERCQTLPDHYTDVGGLKDAQRLGIIGDGWTVDVIAHIFSFLPHSSKYDKEEQ